MVNLNALYLGTYLMEIMTFVMVHASHFMRSTLPCSYISANIPQGLCTPYREPDLLCSD